jgi:hypothetical protein
MSSKWFDDDWLMAHTALALGDTIENVLEMFDLRLSEQSNDIMQILTDGQGETFLGFRNRVFGLIVEMEWLSTWQNLIGSVATELEIPTEAVWTEDSGINEIFMGQCDGANACVWFYDDYLVGVSLQNSVATIRVSLESIGEEVNDLQISTSQQASYVPLNAKVITKSQVIQLLLSCWNSQDSSDRKEATEFARHIVECYNTGKTLEVGAAFELIEKMLKYHYVDDYFTQREYFKQRARYAVGERVKSFV